jgi:arabinan endo-1,5-alpha-L-arabinosidase
VAALALVAAALWALWALWAPPVVASARSGPPRPPQVPELSGELRTHDPALIRQQGRNGDWYVFSTGDPQVSGGTVQIRRSRDMRHWEFVGTVSEQIPAWVTQAVPGVENLWAPDVYFHDGTYYLYYSASSFGSRNSAMFLATSRTGRSGSWKHVGKVWQTSDTDDYNAIDPNLVVDDTGWWLSFGSFWSGLKMIRIDPDNGLPSTKDKKLYALATRPSSVDGAVEAPYIVRHDDYYYLFAAFDACCRGLDSTYRTMVGRSSKVTGPYVDRTGRKMTDGGGTEILASHGSITGPGHPAVLQDEDDWLLIYHHYYDEFNPGAARLGINRLAWVDGWPVAR